MILWAGLNISSVALRPLAGGIADHPCSRETGGRWNCAPATALHAGDQYVFLINGTLPVVNPESSVVVRHCADPDRGAAATVPRCSVVPQQPGRMQHPATTIVDAVEKEPTAGTMPGAELQTVVSDAISNGITSIVIRNAEYDFTTTNGGRPASFAVYNAVNLAIDGSGATLWFAAGSGVHLLNCTNVSLSNFVVDYTPTLSQGTVVSVDTAGNSFVADFDPTFLNPTQLVAPHFPSSADQSKVLFIDPASKRMIRNESVPGAINIFTSSDLIVPVPTFTHRYRVNVTGNLRNGWTLAAVGQPVLVFPRGGPHSLVVEASARVQVTDYRVYGSASMGVVESDGAGGHAYTRFVLARRPLQRGLDMKPLPAPLPFRYLASNADGFHSTSNSRGPTILDSIISWTGDDLANICSAMSVALIPVSSRVSGGGGGNSDGASSTSLAMVDMGRNLARAAKRGDTISFYHLNTLELQGSAIVQSVAPTKDAAALAAMRSGYATMQAPPFNAGFVQGPVLNAFTEGDPIAVTFQGGVIPAFVQKYWSIAVLFSADNSNALVRNTTLSDGYARAFMIKGRDAVFTNTTFRRAGGIWIGPEQNWLEGDPGLRNVTVEGNVFDAIGSPPVNMGKDFNESGKGIVVKDNREL